MMHARFICETHKDIGTRGWRLSHRPKFDPFGGLAVAHDMLEHFPDDDGSVAGEYQALGACIWLRGQGDWYAGRGSYYIDAGYHIAADLARMITQICCDELSHLRKPPATRRSNDDYLESQIDLSLREARENILSEWTSGGDDLETHHIDSFDRQLEIAAGWLRIGYRRAKRRYRGYDPYWLVIVFEAIAKRADQLLIDAYDGDMMTVSVSLRTGEIVAKHICQDDETYLMAA